MPKQRKELVLTLALILLDIVDRQCRSSFRQHFRYCSRYLTDSEFKAMLTGLNKYFKEESISIAWVQYELLQLYTEYI